MHHLTILSTQKPGALNLATERETEKVLTLVMISAKTEATSFSLLHMQCLVTIPFTDSFRALIQHSSKTSTQEILQSSRGETPRNSRGCQ